MKALLFEHLSEPLYLAEVPTPKPRMHDLLVRVAASGVNRADLLQRQGHYPPPPGASPILGLEIAGEVVALGSAVTQFSVGDRVCGLLAGGAYAEYALLDEDLAFSLPKDMSFIEGAAVSEAFLTAYETVFVLGQLKKEDRILIHAAGSSVGLAAMQLALTLGAVVYGTAGSEEKVNILGSYGISAFNYKAPGFLERLLSQLGESSINVALDFIGAKYADLHQQILAADGRWLLLAAMGGRNLNLDALLLIRKRLQLRGFSLRAQSLAQKRLIKARFQQDAWPWLVAGTIKPIIDSVYPVTQANAAHQHMTDNRNTGKIVLQWV